MLASDRYINGRLHEYEKRQSVELMGLVRVVAIGDGPDDYDIAICNFHPGSLYRISELRTPRAMVIFTIERVSIEAEELHPLYIDEFGATPTGSLRRDRMNSFRYAIVKRITRSRLEKELDQDLEALYGYCEWFDS